jgi:hypothetical protein
MGDEYLKIKQTYAQGMDNNNTKVTQSMNTIVEESSQ